MELAILAKEGVLIDLQQEAPPDRVTLPPEPIYEENVDNSTTQSERDRRILNEQLKNAWLNRVRKLKRRDYCAVIDHGSLATRKAVSLTYLKLGIEGRRNFGSQESTIQIDQISTKDLWESLDNVFTKMRIITFDRCTCLTRRQLKREPVTTFYGCPREFSMNCEGKIK